MSLGIRAVPGSSPDAPLPFGDDHFDIVLLLVRARARDDAAGRRHGHSHRAAGSRLIARMPRQQQYAFVREDRLERRRIGKQVKGGFRNEFGALPDFTSAELSSELRRVFPTATDISDDYYDASTCRHAGKHAVLRKAGIDGFVYPSVTLSAAAEPDRHSRSDQRTVRPAKAERRSDSHHCREPAVPVRPPRLAGSHHAARGRLRRLDHLPDGQGLRSTLRGDRRHPHLPPPAAAGGRRRARLSCSSTRVALFWEFAARRGACCSGTAST